MSTSTEELTLSPPRSSSLAATTQSGWLEQRVLAVLKTLRHGTVHLHSPGGSSCLLGEPGEDRLHADVVVHSPRLFREIAFGGSLGAAESYIAGEWSCSSLTTLMRILCRNLDGLTTLDRGWSSLAMAVARGSHWLASNTLRRSRKNIAAHYDLGNEFFELFLDPTLAYSSGLFLDERMTLEEASRAKFDRACRKLELTSSDHLLEIGTGWGGLALHAATEYGCRVTTTTISRNQYELSRARAQAAGLSDRVEVLHHDYRELQGQYDKLVSIEMIEAVGHAFLPEYFATCDRLLRRGGRLLVQAITMPDQRYERYRRSVDFIQKYIFPGGHLPSIGAMQQALGLQTSLVLLDALQFPDSYARTLQEWRKRFTLRQEEIRRLGFDDRFLRMWDYYFCYCEGAFRERAVSIGQFLWEKTAS